MKTANLILLALSVYFVSLNSLFGQTTDNEALFSIDDLQADIRYLKSKLENKHPSLYLYTAKPLIDRAFDSLESSIVAPLTESAFYRHLTLISSIIKDGHTILLPSAKSIEYHNKKSKFIPYHFTILGDRLYVDMACTSDNSIQAGAEIISINKVEATDLLKQLSERQVRDGNNLTYPTWILNNYFRQYYSFVFGHPDTFFTHYKINGQILAATVNALTQDSIYRYRQKAHPDRIFSNIPGDGIKLKIEQDKNYAVLTIKDFHNSILKKEFKQNFKKTISSYFERINDNGSKNLIIDLRNNQGGDIENGVFLLTYLLDRPFEIVKEYFKIKIDNLQKCTGPALGIHTPKSNGFKGAVYILINGGSFSNSGIVASSLQAHNRAIFIGQETGGNPNVISGNIKEIVLPNTKIQVQIPTKQFVITDKENNNGRGVMPAYTVIPTLEDIIQGRDPEMDYVVDLISKASDGR